MQMLRYRPRAVTSKQSKMTDHSSLPSPTQDHTLPISPFLCSPRFFRGFITKGETEPLLSPTSILDTKPLFSLGNPIWYNNHMPKSPTTFPGNKQHLWLKLDSKDIGLAIIGSTPNEDKPLDNSARQSTRMVMFGSQLKVQIPPLPPSAISPPNSPKSTTNSRISNRTLQLGSVSALSSIQTKDSPLFFTGSDRTCVISHGHNLKTTHMIDDFIVEGCCGVGESPSLKKKKEYYSFSDKWMKSKSESFLSFCYTCKKKLGQEKDIYIYKGEKAFCSRACRCQEMMLDGVDNSEFDGAF